MKKIIATFVILSALVLSACGNTNQSNVENAESEISQPAEKYKFVQFSDPIENLAFYSAAEISAQLDKDPSECKIYLFVCGETDSSMLIDGDIVSGAVDDIIPKGSFLYYIALDNGIHRYSYKHGEWKIVGMHYSYSDFMQSMEYELLSDEGKERVNNEIAKYAEHIKKGGSRDIETS